MDHDRIRAVATLAVLASVVGGIGWFGVGRFGWTVTLVGFCLVFMLVGLLFRNIGSAIFWIGLAVVVTGVSTMLDEGSLASGALSAVLGLVGVAAGWKWSGDHAMARIDPYHGIDFPKRSDD